MFKDDTLLDVRGEKFYESIFLYEEKIKENAVTVEKSMGDLREYLRILFPSSQCEPECKEYSVKCLKCNECKPKCEEGVKNSRCGKCTPKLLLFDNSDRLDVNKKRILGLVEDYFKKRGDIVWKNILILIRLRLSVLPSLL